MAIASASSIATDLQETRTRLDTILKMAEELRGIFDIPVKEKRLKILEVRVSDPSSWSNTKEMQKLNKEKALLERSVGEWMKLKSRAEDAKVLLEMAVEASDESTFLEAKTEVDEIEPALAQLELQKMLSGEQDVNNAYLTINSGAGGTEACDWAEILQRMYLRYAQVKGYKTEILDQTSGEGAGIKSCTILISGEFAYGYLKAELGVHRLVRISPFDSNARRHTSFASVFVWPEVDDTIEIEIKTEDLKIDTYRSGGAGGHVNKTDSAVRMTHLPTGLVVQCQSERSQISNREKAMKMMRSALYEREVKIQNAAKDKMHATKSENEWGSQIRSYVLHPYQLVKDHRTGHETSQSSDVLAGAIDDFIMAYLKSGGKSKNVSVPE